MPEVFLGHIDLIWSSEVNVSKFISKFIWYLSKFIGMLLNQPLQQSLNSVFQNGLYEFTRGWRIKLMLIVLMGLCSD